MLSKEGKGVTEEGGHRGGMRLEESKLYFRNRLRRTSLTSWVEEKSKAGAESLTLL